MRVTDKEKELLKRLVDHYDKEDRDIRDRQIRTWRKLKLYWEGFQNIWYSEVAHDWRIWDQSQETEDNNSQAYYDKRVNIFRAYLESIIAALSVTVPPIKCFPDDADNPLDLATAKAGDRISKLIYRHNDVSLLWLHALFIYCTEGLVACYNYTNEDKEYGTYRRKNFKDEKEEIEVSVCVNCGQEVSEKLLSQERDEFQPDDSDVEIQDVVQNNMKFCPECLMEVDTKLQKKEIIVTRFTGETDEPKARQCMEVYGGLYVKVANYAKKQKDTPYLKFAYETDFTFAKDKYEDLRDCLREGGGNSNDEYERWARTSPQYAGELPRNTVTAGNWWFRPSAFQIFDKADADALKKRFPNGAKVVMINEHFAEAANESLDDHWTLTENPLSDYLYHDPLGTLLTSIQDITNDLISLTLQTIEHGIPQTFADPKVLNFDAYGQMETTPGAIYSATPKSGSSMSDAFYEVKTATLSGEVLPFAGKVQEYGQLVSGALPSLFGGQMQGSKTASEYSMSRAQALQRLQNTWKVFTVWWKLIFAKTIPQYIKSVQDDEKFVEQDSFGNFINVFIRKAELEGKIGKIELEANENLPITWAQQKDIMMQLLQSNNPTIQAMLAMPENIPIIYEAIGLDNLKMPDEESVIKQFEEINLLLNSEPIIEPPDEMALLEAEANGLPLPTERELPSEEVDPLLDNHQLEFDICRRWLISEAGRLAKIENPEGYKNVLLHAVQHQQELMKIQMEMQAQQENTGASPMQKPKQNTKAPITGEENVKTE